MFFQTLREKKFRVNEIGERYLRDLEREKSSKMEGDCI
jgi:hypothetical protein